MLVKNYQAEQDREELRKLRHQNADAEQEGLYRKLREVKKGMTVEQAEAIMGTGRKGTMGGQECLAWDYKADGQPVKVYVKVKDGTVSEISTDLREGEGLKFRPKPGQ